MSERTVEQVIAMRRRDLARLHANELSAALFPEPERHDDAIPQDEKVEIQLSVSELVALHRREIAAWEGANG
ncbi:hypothetical protein EDE05_12817 [Neorhizobium sp. R1-B]|uniref:hypothetical protein n=1 Tax=Neorhizobium sp. R1-B TaxID=2485162 RepID=UPI001065EB20|nr:hypothetical protein [Neorhizobium sp. R1-B]TDX72596.1 hypothetical protein EDE05_12817 [Neorhizobium sp. R1-B]